MDKILRLLFLYLVIPHGISFAQCDIPEISEPISYPHSYQYESIASGDWQDPGTWYKGKVPPLTASNKTIKISDSVDISSGSLELISSTLFLEDAHLVIRNGNMSLTKKGATFIAERSVLKVSGNVSQSKSTVFFASHAELKVGDSGDSLGQPLFHPGSTTSANFINDGGYRRLEDACVCLSGNYNNSGTDELVRVCGRIGFINPIDSLNPTGLGSGSLSNNSSGSGLSIYDSELLLPNGNIENNETLITCSTKFKLTDGNVQNKSSCDWSGEDLVLWITGDNDHNLQNDGNWNVGVYALCVNGTVEGTYETPLPQQSCSTIEDLFDPDHCTPIPVTWLSVEAVRIGHHQVELHWSTATEINNAFFTVERLNDSSSTYIELGQLDGAGTVVATSAYRFDDYASPMSETGYRIRQTDFDGSYSYSKLVVADGVDLGHHVMTYPNPTDGDVTFCWDAAHHNTLRIELVDLSGKVIFSEEVEAKSNVHKESLGHLKSGVYIINLYTAEGSIHRNRMIKR